MSSAQSSLDPSIPNSSRKMEPAPLTPIRIYRKQRHPGITLAHIYLATGISQNRWSKVERFPEQARPGEIQILRNAVDQVGAQLDELDRLEREAKP